MKTVLVNKPIHRVALARLQEEAQVLTPYHASYEELMELLPSAQGMILCAGLHMGPAEMDWASQLAVISRHGAGVDLSLIHISEPTRRTIPSRMPSSA